MKKTFTLLIATLLANSIYAQTPHFYYYKGEKKSPPNIIYEQKDCPPISTFPWIEDFENNDTNIPPCWEAKHFDTPRVEWKIVSASTGTPPMAFSGNYKARMYAYWVLQAVIRSQLITPIFDLSTVDAPVLTFAFTKNQLGDFSVYYKNFSSGGWNLLQEFSRPYFTSDWETVVIPLPDKSDHYQIAFESRLYGGGYYEAQLDDVRITEEEVSVSSFHSDNYVLMPNPVQDLLTVERPNATKVKVSVYNSIGVLMHSFETSETKFEINVSNYASGFYFIRLLDNNTSVSKIFVKQ